MQHRLHILKHKVASGQCLKKASQLANQSKRIESPWDGGRCLTLLIVPVVWLSHREEGDPPKTWFRR